MAELKAIIFDCDGVLVDTERDGHRLAFNRGFAAKGLSVEWGVETYGRLLEVGGGKERMRHFFDRVGWPAVDDRDAFILDLHKTKTSAFMEIIASGEMDLRPGVKSLIAAAIEEGVQVAVCSTSNERAVQGIVDHLLGKDIAMKMPVFAGDMVKAKKPDPAIYNLGMEKLDLDPAKCVVVEDSNIGLRAAHAAGTRVVVTMSVYTRNEDFSLAARVVEDLASGGVTLDTCRSLIS